MKKVLSIILIMTMCISIFTSCEKDKTVDDNIKTVENENKEQNLKTVEFTDDLGNKVTVKNPKRVAALSGSFASVWNLSGGKLACVTEDAKEQADLKLDKDVVIVGKLENPNMETLVSAGVDFVILSANISNQVKLADTLKKLNIPYAYFNVETFQDYLKMLDICTDITGHKENYKKYGLDISGNIKTTINDYTSEKSPSVLLLRAYSTDVKAKNSENNMVGKMLKDLGCTNIADSESSLLENLSMEKILEEDPDYIFVTTMGSEDKALATVASKLKSSPAWSQLSAVKNDKFIVLDKQLFHKKPNEKWGESYKILAKMLYGDKK